MPRERAALYCGAPRGKRPRLNTAVGLDDKIDCPSLSRARADSCVPRQRIKEHQALGMGRISSEWHATTCGATAQMCPACRELQVADSSGWPQIHEYMHPCRETRFRTSWTCDKVHSGQHVVLVSTWIKKSPRRYTGDNKRVALVCRLV